MSLTDVAEPESECVIPADDASARRETAESAAYDFGDSTPRFRVVIGSEERPTGFLLRAEDENAARRQLMVAAIRLGFDRTGEDLRLARVADDGDADAALTPAPSDDGRRSGV